MKTAFPFANVTPLPRASSLATSSEAALRMPDEQDEYGSEDRSWLDAPAAERALVGGLLLRPDVLPAVAAFLEPEHFYSEALADIYRVQLRLRRTRCPIDTVTVRETLARDGTLMRVGGDDFLLSLTDTIPIFENLLTYAQLVYERAVRRSLLTTCGALLQRARGPESTETLVEAARLSIEALHTRLERRRERDAASPQRPDPSTT